MCSDGSPGSRVRAVRRVRAGLWGFLQERPVGWDKWGGCPCPQTGCPPLSFTAESGGARQSWAAALQEAVTETLSDYEVAEKIWSNRANLHCADCGASRPDWAAVNLGVVICKQCAGEGSSL